MKFKWLVKAVGYHLGVSDLFFLTKNLIFFAIGSPHEEEFAIFSKLKTEIDFVDIGANAGQSVISFKMFSRRSHVISYEPNPGHRRHLKLLKGLFGDTYR